MPAFLPLLLVVRLALAPAGAAPAPGEPSAADRVAPDSIRGHVTDAEGGPVEGADVSLVELRRHARTAGDGSYRFLGVPPGGYTIVVQRAGYDPVLRTVTVAGTTVLDVALRTAPFPVPAITVTATGAPTATLRSPLAVAEVGAEQLRRHSEVSLAQTLERLPGVHTLATGAQIGKPVVRGLSGQRVLVLDGGNRLEDYSWSDEDGPSIDARTADRVEVVRGPASLLYGPDAIGGVINVIPEEVPDPTAGGAFTRSAVEAYGASNNREVGGTLQLEGAGAGLGWRVAGIGRFAEDLHTPAGPLDNTGYFAANGEAALGKRGPWGAATLRYARYGGEFRLLEAAPAAPPPTSGGGEEGPVRKLADDRLQFQGTFPLGGVRLETRAQYQRHWLAEVSDEAGTAVAGKEQTAFDLTLNTLSGDVAAHHALGDRVHGTAGVSGFLQSHDSRGPITLVPSAQGASGGAYVFEEATLGALSLSGGARGDVRTLSADANSALATPATDRSWQALSADVGAVLTVAPGVALRANIGRAWRAPTLFELFANGPLLSDARYVLGDAQLQAERSTTIDGGVRIETRALRAELSAFRNSMPGFIFIQPLNLPFRQGLRVFQNTQARALLWGMDGGLALEAARWLGLRATGDWVSGQNRATGQPLPLMPAPRASLEAELKGAGPARGGRGWLTVGSEMVARQNRLAPTDVPTAAYALLELGAGVQGTVGRRPMRVDLRVSNALDARYTDFLSRYKEFALNPGRNITLRVGTEF